MMSVAAQQLDVEPEGEEDVMCNCCTHTHKPLGHPLRVQAGISFRS